MPHRTVVTVGAENPLKILRTTEMRELDRRAIHELGVPEAVLMENAGAAVARVALSLLDAGHPKQPHPRRVLLFAGKGNNAGDGFVAARHLLAHGEAIDLKVTLADPDATFTGAAAANLEILRQDRSWDRIAVGRAVCHRLAVKGGGMWEQAGPWGPAAPELIIDALVGTGLTGSPHGIMAEAIELLNSIAATHSCPVLSVDVPSGLDAETGAVGGPCVHATYTVTFAHLKRGLVTNPVADYAGHVLVAGIGFPPSVEGAITSDTCLLTARQAARLLPARPLSGHKGTFGHVVSVAGSADYTGAAWLCAAAALRAGAGLSTLASVREVLAAGAIFPEVITATTERPLDFSPYNALALGPGLGTGSVALQLVTKILDEVLPANPLPAVLHADALNIASMGGGVDFLRGDCRNPCFVLTPHPGELARLLDKSIAAIQSDRIGHALAAASRSQSVVCLKGAHTVVASPSGAVRVIPFGNPGMATGGAGDVLTGVIAGLLANGLEPFNAACLGAYVHAVAGDLAAVEVCRTGDAASDTKVAAAGLLARDILDRIPAALGKLRRGDIIVENITRLP